MRFPLRLTADLTLGLISRAIGANRNLPLILNLGADGNFDPALARRQQSSFSACASSRIVWIAGAQPFAHPEIARISAALLAEKRQLFLEASPSTMRRRIHEFRPVSRFHLTFRFDGFAKLHDRRSLADGSYEQTLASIRGVKLSGFLVCAHIVVHDDTSLEELIQLRGQLRNLDVDGYVITPGDLRPEIQQRVAEARRALLSRRWALFSELLGPVAPPARSVALPEPACDARCEVRCEGHPEAHQGARQEEGAQA